MNSRVFASDRRFVLHSYDVSHGLLLFRSAKRPPLTTSRIDVLFQDVRALEIRCWFEGLVIEEAGLDFLTDKRSNPGQMIEPGNQIYALKSHGWTGFIVGGILRTHEDQGEFFEASRLISP